MLMPFEMVLKNNVKVTDNESHRFGQVGKISFIENKKGFRASYTYSEVSVTFDDCCEESFKSWFLKINEV